ncbi:MAG: hypothetical protein U0414_37850 [Polyangiaceae bacterium]
MKVKVIVVDLELSRRQKLGVVAVGLAALGALAGAAIAAPKTFVAGEALKAADLNASFQDLDGRIAALDAARPVAATAKATGVIGGATGIAAWTTVPGMSVSLTLGQDSLVTLDATGNQRTQNLAATSICHVRYRYVVDGVPRDVADQGQRIDVSNGQSSWHSNWSLTDALQLPPGAHTIALQAHAPTSDTPSGVNNCFVCGESDGSLAVYESCRLNAIAIPE